MFSFLFVCNNSINPCNKNKQHRLKARPTMLHIGLKRTKAASNEQTCWLQHMIPVQQGTSLLQKDYIGFSLVNVEKQKPKIMNHKCDHALKVLLPEQKVKRDHNQTIKTLLLIEDLFSSAGK